MLFRFLALTIAIAFSFEYNFLLIYLPSVLAIASSKAFEDITCSSAGNRLPDWIFGGTRVDFGSCIQISSNNLPFTHIFGLNKQY